MVKLGSKNRLPKHQEVIGITQNYITSLNTSGKLGSENRPVEGLFKISLFISIGRANPIVHQRG